MPITFKEFREVVRTSYEGDDKIYDLYDPTTKVNSIDEIADDIVRKVKEYGDVDIKAVCENKDVIGYMVSKGELLISFAVAVKYRKKKILDKVYYNIKKIMPPDFICYLWATNTRGIKWLQNNGMETIYTNPLIAVLKCQ